MQMKGLAVGMLAAGIAILGSGCASTEEIDKLRGMVEQAQSAASDAKSTAGRAMDAAQEAKSAAGDADRKASEALRAANDANNCCRQNSEKLDRMFKKSMMK